MEIYILRHCESESNLTLTHFNGNLNGPLTKKGFKQAKILGKKLRNLKIDAIFTSTLIRSKETANAITKANKKRIPIIIDKRLDEISPGIFGGLSPKEIKEKYWGIYVQRKRDKFNHVIPGGESYKQVYRRVNSFMKDLLNNKKYSRVLIVTHTTTLKLFLHLVTRKNLKKIEKVHYQHGKYFIFDLDWVCNHLKLNNLVTPS